MRSNGSHDSCSLRLAALVALVTTMTASIAAQAAIIASYSNPTNGHTYHLIGGPSGEPITWAEAEAQAVALGGHLATVNDAAENTWISSTITSVDEVWIGLTDVDSEGTFVWASGEPVTYTNWNGGEPNNSAPDPGEDYVELYCGSNPQAPRWNDYAGTTTLLGLAEVPEPTRLLVSGPFLTNGTTWREIHAFATSGPAIDVTRFGDSFTTKPDCIVTGPDGLLYVAVFAEARIDKLNPVSGRAVGSVTLSPPLVMPEHAQRNFTVLPDGRFLIVADEEGRIDIYAQDGIWLDIWRPTGTPRVWSTLELTPNGTVAFIVGHGSYPNEVHEYSQSGNFLRTIIPASAGRQMSSLAFTTSEEFLIAEYNGCIERYDVTSASFSSFACHPDACPLWITRDPLTGSVFATSHCAADIRGWSEEGTPLYAGQPLWDYGPPYLYATDLIIVTTCGSYVDCNDNLISDDCDIAHDCCETGHGSGCSYEPIESCVCDADRYCCLVEWDDVCVERVTSGECGPCDIDCNANAVPDECDIADGTSHDCQPDRVPDECQTADNDCDTNGVPDDCELDLDGDGLIDACDDDIDGDGVPNDTDECDNTPLGRAVDAAGRPLGDIDRDCDTDMEDYMLFLSGFTGPLN